MRDAEARESIELAARRVRAPLRSIDTDFDYSYLPPKPPLTRPAAGRVRVHTWRRNWGVFDLPLLGPHQAHNAALALASLDALAEQGIVIDSEAVRRGFAGLHWPAHMEVFGNGPWLVIDGAHNVASAQAFAETLRLCFPKTPRTLIFGTSRDKDLIGQVQVLLPLFDRIIVTRYLLNPRSVPPQDIAECVRSLGYANPTIADDPASALSLARGTSSPDSLICVTGSLFLAAEAAPSSLDGFEREAAGKRNCGRAPRFSAISHRDNLADAFPTLTRPAATLSRWPLVSTQRR